MPVTEEYREYIVERLQTVMPIRWRKMFGGLGIFYDRLPFALAADNTLYFKVNEENRGDYEEANMDPFRPFGDKSYSMSYYEVPEHVLEDPEILADWVKKSLKVAENSQKSKIMKKPSIF